MKKLLCVFAVLFGASECAFAIETTVGGFIAVDLLELTKVEDERQRTRTGIGALDLKVFVRKEKSRFKLKLDLDDSNIGTPYRLFEEALLTRELDDRWSFDVGKGQVAFTRKHWAVIMPSYFDGGTIIGGFHWTYVDIDNMILLAVNYGSPALGLRNTLTFWGDPEMTTEKTGDGGQVYDAETGKPLLEDASKVFDPREQRGLANRLELYLTRRLTLSTALVAYWHKHNPHANYAVNAGVDFITPTYAVWLEALHGVSSSFAYSYKDRSESVAQVGGEYFVLKNFSFVADAESAVFEYQNTSAAPATKVAGIMSKAELGGRYGFDKLTYWTNGAAYEVAQLDSQSGKTATRFMSSFSHWF